MVLGASLLTEFTGLIVVGIAGLIMLTHSRLRRYIPLLIAVVLIVAGWWYVRNWIKYGDPTLVDVMYDYWPETNFAPGVSFAERAERLPWIYGTTWARFHCNTVMVSGWIYRVFDGMVILSALGLGYWFWHNRRILIQWFRESPALPIRLVICSGLLAGAIFVATIAYNFQNTTGYYGRFLLLAIAAWIVVLITGMTAWFSARIPLWAGTIGAIFLAVVAGFALWDYSTSFRIYPIADPIPTPLAYNYEKRAELLGTDTGLIRARPGDRITVALYWRSLQPTPDDLMVYVHSVESPIVQRNSYPATGNLVSTEWEPDETWAEYHIIRIPADAQPQRMVTLIAGLYEPATHYTLQAANHAGNVVTPVIGQLAINGPAGELDTRYRFDQLFGLAAPQISYDRQQVTTCLQWQALRETTISYTVFIHIEDGQGNSLAQKDLQPKQGTYPTNAWAKGEVVEECTAIPVSDLPTGWSLALGMYSLEDMVRLPIYTQGSNERQPNDQLVIRSEEVVTP